MTSELNSTEKKRQPGNVALVGTGPGDPELITLKAIRLLRSADVIFYDRLCNPDFLDYARSGTRKVSVGKQPGKPSVSQHDINRKIVGEAQRGKCVVRLKGGDPFVFGRGGEECLELSRNGIPFEVVPGISSVMAVPAYAGIPLTMRNQATGFTVISGHLHAGSDSYDWAALSSISTLVILMGMRNLDHIIENLLKHGKPANTPIALIHWGTTREQKVITGTLTDIHDKTEGVTAPVTIVIGDVVRHHETLDWYRPETGMDISPQMLHQPCGSDTIPNPKQKQVACTYDTPPDNGHRTSRKTAMAKATPSNGRIIK